MIKSSFKKIDKNASSSQKAYFGHPDLDAILYNSLAKGHFMVLQQDHPTTNYLSLLRYYVSSNYHKAIPSLIYDSNPQKWKQLISPVRKTQSKPNHESKSIKSEIAWRYDQMQINFNQLIINEEILQLDLGKNVQKTEQSLILSQQYPSGSILDFYRKIQEDYINCQADGKDERSKKILIASLPSYFYKDPKLSQFLHALRCMTRSSHLTTLVTLPPIISEETRNIFLLYSDYYLQIGKVGEGYKDFNSSLTILKEAAVGQIRTRYRGVSVWGIKNKKQQLRIESLYEQAVSEELAEEKSENKDNKIQF